MQLSSIPQHWSFSKLTIAVKTLKSTGQYASRTRGGKHSDEGLVYILGKNVVTL